MTASMPDLDVPSIGYDHSFVVRKTSRSLTIVSFISAVNSGSNCPKIGKDIARSTLGSTSTGPGVMIVRGEGEKCDGKVMGRCSRKPAYAATRRARIRRRLAARAKNIRQASG